MQTNNRWRIALAALMMVGGTGTLWAQQGFNPALPTPSIVEYVIPNLSGANRLKGLKGVCISGLLLIDDKDLTKESIKRPAELSIIRNRIRLFSGKELESTIGTPILTVFLDTRIYSDPRSRYSVKVTLSENVRLERNPRIQLEGVTVWEKEQYLPETSSSNDLMKSVERLVDEFCLDYLKANPK